MRCSSILNYLTVFVLLSFYCLPLFSQTEETAVFKKHTAPVKAVAYSTDGKTLATGGEDKMICLWDPMTAALKSSIRTTCNVKSLMFTDDGNILAACGNSVVLMDQSGKYIRTFTGYTTDVWSFSYHAPTGKIAAGSYSKTIKIWDFRTSNLVLSLEGHERSCLPVCFDPSGKWIASGSLDKSVRLWDAADGKPLAIMEIHSSNIFALAFHPSGKYLASASGDKTIRFWNIETRKVVRTYTGHDGVVFDVQFSKDGEHLITCGSEGSIILWETATGKKVHTFNGHTGPVNSVRFSNDGDQIMSASDDKTVRSWTIEKKYFLEGTFYEKEIEKEIETSPLFTPKTNDESRQTYDTRRAEAEKFLESLYDQRYIKYREMLGKLPLE